MINKLSSEVLCAHVHDVMFDHGISQRNINAFVSTIYGCDRTIQLCKEIASLAKSVIANSDIDYATFNHIPFKRRHGEVVIDKDDGLPILVGADFEGLNTLIHLPQSDSRDKSLILLTKLHGYVQPLRVDDAVKRTPDMFRNIMSEKPNIPIDFQRSFRKLVRERLEQSRTVQSYDWKEHILPLHTLGTVYYGSGKKKPCIIVSDGKATFDNAQEANQLQAYILPMILMGQDQRQLYLNNKEEYLTLVTGESVTRVKDDRDLLQYPVVDYHVGRIGIRMQEAEKVRTLWMPKVVYEALTNPIVEVLEGLVKEFDDHQTTHIDDSIAASHMRESFFPEGQPSMELIYSIDQSSFTDKFPYRNLQRIVLEELYDMNKIPYTSLMAYDTMVEGAYQPSNAFTKRKVWTEDVVFICGTPMGDPGAFMLATLTHQFVIEWCQRNVRVDSPFFVQGDDAVLRGTKLYNKYCDTMSMLGCTINESKTMQSYNAMEYCGYISTPTISVPMYRPHDRYHDDPKDVVSPRAKEAFGEDTLVGWIKANRPDILLPLGIMGYLPDTEFPDTDNYLVMRDVCTALSQGSKLLQPGETEEHRDRYYGIRQYYPEVDVIEPQRFSRMRRSDYGDYTYLISYLKRHVKCLKSDPDANLLREASIITDICSTLEENYKDRIPVLHPPKVAEEEDERGSRNPNKPKVGIRDVTLSTAKRAINIVERQRQAEEEERSGSSDDEHNLPEL